MGLGGTFACGSPVVACFHSLQADIDGLHETKRERVNKGFGSLHPKSDEKIAW